MQFEGAYGMIEDLKKFDVMPTTSMYNCIMAGYFREVGTPFIMLSSMLELS